jgi:hypothetical protein
MKRFTQFIIEAKETRASEQAKKLGLVGDGHGDWYNSQGEFVAKTVSGKLEFFNKGQRVGQRDIPPKAGAAGAQAAPQAQAAPSKGQPVAPQPVGADQQQPVRGEDEFLTVVFAKFNPPTKEHKKLFSTAQRVSAGGEFRIYPSRTQDSKQNPLNPNRKISYLRKMFPEIAELIVNNPEMKTIFDVLVAANEDGYSNINIVVGSDRLSEMQSLSAKHNGTFYQFNEIKVIPTGNFDSEKDSSGISSGMLRKAAADNNIREFKRGMPKGIKENDVKKLLNDVRKGMGLKQEVAENYNLWEIAPDLDYKNLRENYVKNKIFRIGDVVENMNTGLVGKVIRRGTNYLICVTEEDVMFKSWIKDLAEYTEVKMDSPMRDEKHPNTLVGTLGAFKHYASLTPGAIGTNSQNLQKGGKAYGVNFINKYRKIKESIYSNGY